MLEKLKNFAESVKSVVLYIITPVAFIAGYIWYLLSKNESLEQKLQEKEGEEKLNELKGEQTKVDESAATLLDKYEKLRSSYVSGNPDSLRSGSGHSTDPDSDKGSGTEPGPSYVKGEK